MPNARFSPELLEAIRTNTYIETELDFTNQPFSDAKMAELVAALEMNTHIKSLEMLNCAIGSTAARILAANTTLTTLDVSYNRMGPEGVEALAANTTLRTLKVAETKMGPEGVEALAANTTLTTLDVSGNEIGLAGVKALAANTTLRTLDVSCNKIGPEGVEALAANTTLTTLNVSFNRLGPQQAEVLAANTTLTTLDVSSNEIDSEGARVLADNTTLTTLNVSDNEIGPEGIQAFLANRILTTLTALGCGRRSMTPVLVEQMDAMLDRNRKYAAVMSNTVALALRVPAARAVEGTGLEGISRSIVPLAGLIRDFAGFDRTANAQDVVDRFMEEKAPIFASLVAGVRDEKEDEEGVDAAATPF